MPTLGITTSGKCVFQRSIWPTRVFLQWPFLPYTYYTLPLQKARKADSERRGLASCLCSSQSCASNPRRNQMPRFGNAPVSFDDHLLCQDPKTPLPFRNNQKVEEKNKQTKSYQKEYIYSVNKLVKVTNFVPARSDQ